MGFAPAQPIAIQQESSQPDCRYCDGAVQPPEQFYETKLFRVVVKRDALVNGHVAILPKKHDSHFYSFNLDQLEEFSYLIKKVSFIAMRLTNASGFTMMMNDGTTEAANREHLMIDIIPRQLDDAGLAQMLQQQQSAPHTLENGEVTALVLQLHDLMQLPQE